MADEPEFGESLSRRLRRLVLGTADAFQPRRIHLMPMLLARSVMYALKSPAERRELPSSEPFAEEGLVGICGDLSPLNVIRAYRRGLIPTCHVGPMKWWRPAIRAVLFFEDAHIETKVSKLLRKAEYRVTFDQDFAGVVRACSLPRKGRVPLTWITPSIMRAFWDLHQLGYAHSTEVWDRSGRLVGDMYGLALGRVYFGESQFSVERDTAKLAAAVLNAHLSRWGFVLRDAKWISAHHAQAGFRTIPRAEFERVLAVYAQPPDDRTEWEVDRSLVVEMARPEARSTPLEDGADH